MNDSRCSLNLQTKNSCFLIKFGLLDDCKGFKRKKYIYISYVKISKRNIKKVIETFVSVRVCAESWFLLFCIRKKGYYTIYQKTFMQTLFELSLFIIDNKKVSFYENNNSIKIGWFNIMSFTHKKLWYIFKTCIH